MSYALNGFGQDPLSCLAQGGIPTADGGCVLVTGKPPEQIQCEVKGGQWIGGMCMMPGGQAPPIDTGGLAVAARAICAGLGGQVDPVTGDCVWADGRLAKRDLDAMAREQQNTPPQKSSAGPLVLVAAAAVVGGITYMIVKGGRR